MSVASLFPEWSARRVNDSCRAGKIPGAFKAGATWMISTSDLGKVSGAAKGAPSVADAEQDLRARGVL